MISDAKEIIDRLNGPSDWAVVGGAATIGLIADGTINIMPFPFFSPGMCALAAAGGALSLKRAFEASVKFRRLRRRMNILHKEADRCLEVISKTSRSTADDLRWRIDLDGAEIDKLEAIVREARVAAKSSNATYGLQRVYSRGMAGVLAGASVDFDDGE